MSTSNQDRIVEQRALTDLPPLGTHEREETGVQLDATKGGQVRDPFRLHRHRSSVGDRSWCEIELGGRADGGCRPSPSAGRCRPSPFPTTVCLPGSLLPPARGRWSTRIPGGRRRRPHGPKPVTLQTNHAVRSHLQQPLSRRPTELADGLALKEPAPPTTQRGTRPNHLGPPLPDTSVRDSASLERSTRAKTRQPLVPIWSQIPRICVGLTRTR